MTGRDRECESFAAAEAEEHRRIIVHHLFDRMREHEGYSFTLRVELQQAAAEILALRQRLDLVNPHDLRNLEQLYAVRSRVAPVGSVRERLLIGTWRVARGLALLPGRSLRWIRRRGAAMAPPPDADPESAPPEASPTPKVQEPVFAPLQWRIQTPSDAGAAGISLILLSAAHRSGSTLLQRLCNARKRTLIWGEHGALLKYYPLVYGNVAYFSTTWSHEREEFFRQKENPNLWTACMSPDLRYAQQAVVNSVRAMLETLYGQYRGDHDIIGFKEVCYDRPVLELLRACYPEGHLLLLVRNPLNTWRSTPRHWSPSLERWTANWNDAVECFRDFDRTDDHCHLLRYEDIVCQEPGAMKVLMEVAALSQEEITSVLANKIGGSQRKELDPSERDFIREECRATMESLGYA